MKQVLEATGTSVGDNFEVRLTPKTDLSGKFLLTLVCTIMRHLANQNQNEFDELIELVRKDFSDDV